MHQPGTGRSVVTAVRLIESFWILRNSVAGAGQLQTLSSQYRPLFCRQAPFAPYPINQILAQINTFAPRAPFQEKACSSLPATTNNTFLLPPAIMLDIKVSVVLYSHHHIWQFRSVGILHRTVSSRSSTSWMRRVKRRASIPVQLRRD